MKKVKLMMWAVLCIFIATAIQAHHSGEQIRNEEIIAIKLSKASYEKLKLLEDKAFTVDSKGFLYPTKNYTIRYEKSLKSFFVTANLHDKILPVTRDGSEDLGYGLVFRCWSVNVCDDCQPNNLGSGWYCSSRTCRCFEEIVIIEDEVSEVQTLSGNLNPGELR
ncbi:MAG TPA: hypothetical protein PKA53_06635 [Sphingobacterium sp.]|nr:hypothetical protein [Sphingobacterium sp.]